ncbi:DUF3298 and DUF4163 domain-containing protein [Phytohalomonas tamaricis]|uniref:DUF3298 and DUF4163 domain-containing protein n=1 Tax=Phytohalomonas tamaricis TaxID=2081032 RepID=UPI001319DCA8|nr:DUF3298 and DUF4163 domain-containing protein [Phytohalomonas tamaricis]
MMRSFRWSVLLGLTVTLAACQNITERTPPPDPPAVLEIQRVERLFIEPDCSGDHCARVSADYLRFVNDAALSAELKRRLLVMAGGIGNGSESPAASFDAYAHEFFSEARKARTDYPDTAPYHASVTAEVIADHDGLLILALNNYIFIGGAHGMPVTQYMVIDQHSRQIVTLDDMLRDGQRHTFDAALERAHNRWLEQLGEDQAFAAQWPLSSSSNVAPLDEDVVVKYQAYDLGPYAIGQPELHIPYAELKGIFKPRYLH